MPKSNDDLTKQDLEKTLEAHAKTIELQILVSQQQNKLLEHLALCLEKVKEIDAHFSNGFRSELKVHITQEIRDVKDLLSEVEARLEKMDENSNDRCRSCVSSFNEGVSAHDDRETEALKGILVVTETLQEKVEEIDRRTWQQMWIWGSIALFTLVNAIVLIVGLWQNAWIIRS